MERNYQIKKVEEGYHITRNDSRNGNRYENNIELSELGTIALGEVIFTGHENGTISIVINGVGEATFAVDGYGNLWAVAKPSSVTFTFEELNDFLEEEREREETNEFSLEEFDWGQPEEPLTVAKQIKDWLVERNYQFRKDGDKYRITRNDSRNGNRYENNIELSELGTIALGEVIFTGHGNGTLSISINGVGTATFEVDRYGTLREAR